MVVSEVELPFHWRNWQIWIWYLKSRLCYARAWWWYSSHLLSKVLPSVQLSNGCMLKKKAMLIKVKVHILSSQNLSDRGVKSKVDVHGLKWTVHGVKMNPNDWKWPVMGETGRSKRPKLDDLRNWTVLKSKSGRSKERKLNWFLVINFKVKKGQTGRSFGMKTVHSGSTDRLVWLKWPLSLAQDLGWNVHFHPFGPSSLDLTPIENDP